MTAYPFPTCYQILPLYPCAVDQNGQQIQIQRDSNGKFQKVSIDVGPIGDSSVPESSAVLPGTEIHPVRQYQGTLFNDKDLKMRLKFELLHYI